MDLVHLLIVHDVDGGDVQSHVEEIGDDVPTGNVEQEVGVQHPQEPPVETQLRTFSRVHRTSRGIQLVSMLC